VTGDGFLSLPQKKRRITAEENGKLEDILFKEAIAAWPRHKRGKGGNHGGSTAQSQDAGSPSTL